MSKYDLDPNATVFSVALLEYYQQCKNFDQTVEHLKTVIDFDKPEVAICYDNVIHSLSEVQVLLNLMYWCFNKNYTDFKIRCRHRFVNTTIRPLINRTLVELYNS